MNLRSLLPLCAATIISFYADAGAGAQKAPPPVCPDSGAAASARCLRTLYFQQDYFHAYTEGAALVARAPDSPRLRAWLAANLAADMLEDSALVVAEGIEARWPASPWGPFARALALRYKQGREAEAIAAARLARTRAPRERDTWWAYASALSRARKDLQAAAVVDSAVASLGATPELLAMKGSALLQQGYYQRQVDSAAVARAGEALSRALRLDSGSVAALAAWSRYQGMGEHTAESRRAAARAAALAPRSLPLQSERWGEFDDSQKLTQEQKRDSVAARLAAYGAAYGDSPALRLVAVQLWRWQRQDSLRAEAGAQLLKDYPTSVQAEALLYQRTQELLYNIYSRKVADTLQARADMRRMLREFIARPTHRSQDMLGLACFSLFQAVQHDSTLGTDELVGLVRGMQHLAGRPSETRVAAALALADRAIDLPLAEQLAAGAPPLLRPQLESERQFFSSDGEYEDAVAGFLAGAYDALGWVYFKEGRTADAGRLLARALATRRDHALALYHSALVAEARGEGARSLELLGRGYVAERNDDWRPSEAALKQRYLAQHGSADGYEAYLVQLQEQARAARKARVVATREARPRPLPAFSLKRLGSGTFSSDSLRGKVAFVNFWGVWCGPCVREAPQIQALYERYRSDPDVVILTIDTNEPMETVQKYMADKKLSFPVLLDDHYVTRAGVRGFPTTWFVGRAGRIIYVEDGASDGFGEAAIWRIEALKAERRPVTLR